MTTREAAPVDLSVLAADERHWQQVMHATMDRVDEVLAARSNPWTVLASWNRPVLAAAAAVVILLIPVEFALEKREQYTARVDALVDLSAGAVRDGRQPAADDIARTAAGSMQ